MFLGRFTIFCILAASVLPCNEDPGPPELPAEDQRLVDELVTLYRARLLALAEDESGGGQENFVEPDLEEKLQRLGLSPARGAAVLQAVHDSLLDLREELVGFSSE